MDAKQVLACQKDVKFVDFRFTVPAASAHTWLTWLHGKIVHRRRDFDPPDRRLEAINESDADARSLDCRTHPYR
jgi:hypothetical protein